MRAPPMIICVAGALLIGSLMLMSWNTQVEIAALSASDFPFDVKLSVYQTMRGITRLSWLAIGIPTVAALLGLWVARSVLAIFLFAGLTLMVINPVPLTTNLMIMILAQVLGVVLLFVGDGARFFARQPIHSISNLD